MAVDDIGLRAVLLFYIGLQIILKKERGSDEKSVVIQPKKIHNYK